MNGMEWMESALDLNKTLLLHWIGLYWIGLYWIGLIACINIKISIY